MELLKQKKPKTKKQFIIIFIIFVGVGASLLTNLKECFTAISIPQLEEFEFIDDNFKVKLFDAPKIDDLKSESTGYVMRGKMFSSQKNDYSLIIVYYNLPEEFFADANLETLVDLFIMGKKSGMGISEIIEKKEISKNNIQGYEVRFRIENRILTEYYYLHNYRIYNVVGVSVKDNKELIEEFYDSFLILK